MNFDYFCCQIGNILTNFVLLCSNIQIKHTISKLQSVVCSDGRFRAMREALHRCDPPCIPYLGMYLTDLSFIEEGTPDFTPDGLLNFSKMRMVCTPDRIITADVNWNSMETNTKTLKSKTFPIAWRFSWLSFSVNDILKIKLSKISWVHLLKLLLLVYEWAIQLYSNLQPPQSF